MRREGSPEEWEKVRLIAANMFDQDLETDQIAASLKVDDQTVRRWRRTYQRGGREALRFRQHKGRASRISPEQKQQLGELLLKKPTEFGFDKHLWTQQLIADLIQREFGISYHHDHIGIILREIGFTHQKPTRRARERNEAAIETWRCEVWPQLLKKTARTAE